MSNFAMEDKYTDKTDYHRFILFVMTCKNPCFRKTTIH